jgi:hypothetical protein
MALLPVQVVISVPAYATGCVPHEIVLVDVVLVHPFMPVKVSVAVKLPDGVVGTK